jgi:hypothetical protein
MKYQSQRLLHSNYTPRVDQTVNRTQVSEAGSHKTALRLRRMVPLRCNEWGSSQFVCDCLRCSAHTMVQRVRTCTGWMDGQGLPRRQYRQPAAGTAACSWYGCLQLVRLPSDSALGLPVQWHLTTSSRFLFWFSEVPTPHLLSPTSAFTWDKTFSLRWVWRCQSYQLASMF